MPGFWSPPSALWEQGSGGGSWGESSWAWDAHILPKSALKKPQFEVTPSPKPLSVYLVDLPLVPALSRCSHSPAKFSSSFSEISLHLPLSNPQVTNPAPRGHTCAAGVTASIPLLVGAWKPSPASIPITFGCIHPGAAPKPLPKRERAPGAAGALLTNPSPLLAELAVISLYQ